MACDHRRHWHIFLAPSLLLFCALFILFLILRYASKYIRRFCRKSKEENAPRRHGRNSRVVVAARGIKGTAQGLVSGDSAAGKVVVIFYFVLNMSYFVLYLVDVEHVFDDHNCRPFATNYKMQVEVAVNILFALFFILRFLASTDKLLFLFEMYTIVDIITIPPIFVGAAIDRFWLGLRFMRILYLMALPDIMLILKILHTQSSIRIVQLITMFVGVWTASSGFVYLVENTGDPFWDFSNPETITFWDSFYYMLVTMSTVGYGDISCKTLIGKIFMVIYICGAFVMFAKGIPQIVEHFSSRPRYRHPYKKNIGKRHVIVCGWISFESAQSFLHDFHHEDRNDTDTHVVFVNTQEPSLDLAVLIKNCFGTVTYFQGSVLNYKDLVKVKMNTCDACLILANRSCDEPDEEDAANVMRAIAVKNFRNDVRVIIQLMQHRNKDHLMNIPTWNKRYGDEVVCLSELKLGLMAQSCLAPGFATLMANTFVMRALPQWKKKETWIQDYQRGASMEMYTEYLSPTFDGLTFAEASIICFNKLNLLLVALEIPSRKEKGESFLTINPGPDVHITAGTQGFFICQSEEDSRVARYYCRGCDDVSRKQFVKCGCYSDFNMNGDLMYTKVLGTSSSCNIDATRVDMVEIQGARQDQSNRVWELQTKTDSNKSILPRLDAIGIYHWCNERSLEDAILSPSDDNSEILSSHLVVCLLTSEDSPILGVSDLVMPLRSSSFRSEDLVNIVIICQLDYIQKEWDTLKHFPKVYIIPGSPLDRPCLREAELGRSRLCVIISGHAKSGEEEVDPSLVDKEAVLCTLNIKRMSQDGYFTGFTESNEWNKNGIMKKTVQMITQIGVDSNIMFLDQDDEDDPDLPLYLSQPFACGQAFAASLLDNLMSAAYYNHSMLAFIRALVTAAGPPELEQLQAEGLVNGNEPAQPRRILDRCMVSQLDLSDDLFVEFGTGSRYGELFVSALRRHGSLCLGLYRLLGKALDQGHVTDDRYVITSPPSDFPLLPHDKVFCLRPFVRIPAQGTRGDKETVLESSRL